MPTGLRQRSLLRTALPFVVWASAAGAAVWIYRQGAGAGDAVAVAETKEYKVSPAGLGRLIALDVVEGQRIAPGQAIARLETELIQRELSVAEARRQMAASEVRATGAFLDVGALQAERAFQSEIEAAEIELQEYRSASARDAAELSKVLEDIARQRDLVRRGLTKADRLAELDVRRAALEEAVKAWPSRTEAVKARRQSALARLAEWRRTHAENEGGSRKAQLQPAYDKVREQDESIQLLRTHLHNTVLRAPSSGYVSQIYARPGDVLTAGQPVLTIVEAQPRQLIAYVEERRGAPVAPGSRVIARRRTAARERFEATVTTVAGQVTELPLRVRTNPGIPSWGRAVYIELPPQPALDPGETVDVTLLPSAPARPQLNAGWRRLLPLHP